MKKLLLALFVLPTMVFGQSTDLFISEYAEGAPGQRKFIEIYNATGNSIDLTNYRIRLGINGAQPTGTGVALTGTIANNSTFSVGNTDVPSATLTSSNLSFNGDDAVILEKQVNGSWIALDVFGVPGNDPGTGWEVAGVANGTADNRISRNANVCSPTATWNPAEWTILGPWTAAMPETPSFNNHTANCAAATTCTISAAGLTAITCDNAGTATVETDDNIKFSLNPTAQLNATAYNVTVPVGYTVSPATANYGSATEFTLVKTDANAAGGGSIIVTITDATDTTCTLDVTITDPGVCSFTVPTLITSTSAVTIPNYLLPFNSPVRSFTFSGQTLEGNVTVTAPANFEISKNNIAYGSTLVFIAGEHTEMSDSIVYVRSIATTIGAQTGTITISTPNVDETTTATVTVSTQITGEYVPTTFAAIKTNTENGETALENQKVSVTGVTACTNLHASRYNFYILDENEEGIYIFRNNFFTSYTFNSGDSLIVYGTVDSYNGLTQVVADSIVLVEAGIVLDLTPTVIQTITEANESNYVMLEDVRFETRPTTGVWPTGNVTLVKGDYSFIYRVQSQTGLNGQAIPESETFTVKGFASQFTEDAPFNTGYQLYPCSANDVIPGIVVECENPATGAITYDAETFIITAADQGENISYQWLNCGPNAPQYPEILFQTAQTLTATESGSYQVRVINAAPGCQPVLSECFEVEIGNTSVKGILAASTQIFPNPFNTALTIVSEKAVAFSVIDVQGKTVATSQEIAGKASINTESWLQGVYFIQLVGENGESHTVKVVK